MWPFMSSKTTRTGSSSSWIYGSKSTSGRWRGPNLRRFPVDWTLPSKICANCKIFTWNGSDCWRTKKWRRPARSRAGTGPGPSMWPRLRRRFATISRMTISMDTSSPRWSKILWEFRDGDTRPCTLTSTTRRETKSTGLWALPTVWAKLVKWAQPANLPVEKTCCLITGLEVGTKTLISLLNIFLKFQLKF